MFIEIVQAAQCRSPDASTVVQQVSEAPFNIEAELSSDFSW
jgi:hypothetical protein